MARQATSNNSNKTFNKREQAEQAAPDSGINFSNKIFNKREQAEQAAPDSGVIFKVEHVRDWGRNGGITFSLRIEGPITAEIYGCRIKNSRDGEYVAFPQRKGNDGQYYKHAWMQLTDVQTDEIISAVYDALESA